MTTSSVSHDSDNLKRCSVCREWKPLEAFSRCKSRRDGLQHKCKACQRKWREANKERIAERNREYRAANRERIAEYDRAYYAKNVKRIAKQEREYRATHVKQKSERMRKYRAANKERIAERNREYYTANREQYAARRRAYRQTEAGKAAQRAGDHNRRAREQAAGSALTTADIAAVRAAQTDKRGRLICWRCGKPIKGTPHLDHWIPLSKGGTNDSGNLHYMHAHCNQTKNAKHPAELGRLI